MEEIFQKFPPGTRKTINRGSREIRRRTEAFVVMPNHVHGIVTINKPPNPPHYPPPTTISKPGKKHHVNHYRILQIYRYPPCPENKPEIRMAIPFLRSHHP